MTRVVVVTSGKGGVGKTTTSASFASGLAMRGKKTAVIDFDIGLRNLDLILGCERRVVYDFINVIQGDAKLSQALVRDKRNENLSILAAFNPWYAITFLMHEGFFCVIVLGAVFLTVTGAEALYADLGHFGRSPIRFSTPRSVGQ